MVKISIIAVGSLKEHYWKEAIAEYSKRLSPFAKIEVIEVPEVPFSSASEAPRVMTEEANRLKKRLPKDAFLVAMDRGGRELASSGLADLLTREARGGRGIAFVIGGSLGLAPTLAHECHLKLSLSKMTFTHGQARAILFEQLYRAVTIIAGKTYHY